MLVNQQLFVELCLLSSYFHVQPHVNWTLWTIRCLFDQLHGTLPCSIVYTPMICFVTLFSFNSHPTHYSNQFRRHHMDVPFGLEFQPDALIWHLISQFDCLWLTLSLALTFAPCSKNSLTTDSCPYQQARWRGVKENYRKENKKRSYIRNIS